MQCFVVNSDLRARSVCATIAVILSSALIAFVAAILIVCCCFAIVALIISIVCLLCVDCVLFNIWLCFIKFVKTHVKKHLKHINVSIGLKKKKKTSCLLY